MKSPWRFLSDLTSRRKPAQAPLQLPAPTREHLIEDDKLKLEGATAPAVLAVTPIAVSEETEEALATTDQQSLPVVIESENESSKTEHTSPEIPGEAEPSTASLPKAETPLTAEIEPERPDDAVSSETGVTPAKRVKPAKGRTTAPTTTVAVDVAKTNVPAAQPLDFFGEASALDAEITELKLALAQKLKQQNAQLKKMLARFDVG